ncbi:MAG: MarR family transcriptional regulator, partial [Dehalococcoidia bacterium]
SNSEGRFAAGYQEVTVDTDLVDRALRAFGEAVNLVEPLRVKVWRDRGLTIAQIGMLFLLHEQDGQSIGEVARRLRSRPATVTGLADRLERAGFVRRGGDEFDRRIVRLRLTDEGHRVLDEIRAESRAYLGAAFEALGHADTIRLADLLGAFVLAASIAAERPEAKTVTG